jgi:hypothetical protein
VNPTSSRRLLARSSWHASANTSRVSAAVRRRRLGDGLTPTDLELVKELFAKLLDSFRTEKGSRSPVGAGKALHALAPAFLPSRADRAV